MKQEPLTESYFYILLCLAHGPNHGYGIMQETAALSNGRVRIGSGTMYGATSNMLKKKWIEDYGNEEGQERRRLYQLLPAGREVLEAEVRRLRSLVENADLILGGESYVKSKDLP